MHSSELLSASKFIIIWDSSPSLAFPIASISVAVQGTANASLHETWIKFEELFNCLDEVKRAFNAMGTRPTWIREIQTAIEKMWSKLRDYYSNTECPFAFIDSTLLHPVLKVSFMKKAKYSDDDITNYKREGEQRYHCSYDSSVPVIIPSIPVGNVLVPPHPIQSPQMAKISMSSPITLQRNETSRLRIRWPGGLNRSPFSRNCQRWLAMYMLFLQLGQESKESSVYREE